MLTLERVVTGSFEYRSTIISNECNLGWNDNICVNIVNLYNEYFQLLCNEINSAVRIIVK